jgi:hypothetical protein
VRLAPEEQAEAARVLGLLEEAGMAPPEATALDVSRRLLEALLRGGRLESVGSFLYEANAFRRGARLVRDEAAAPGGITVSQMRSVLGITRKHAVPLAEAFDQRRFTVRRGDARFPGPVDPFATEA